MKGLCLLILFILTATVFLGKTRAGEDAGGRPLVLVTTYPLYQIARAVTGRHDGMELELLLAPDAGCPHGYALTPGEMAKLARADALVVNGLGMEDFLGAALENAGGGIDVFDTSESVGTSLYLPIEEDAHGEEEYNPHLYASPLAQTEIAAGMAEFFAQIDPGGADYYRDAAQYYGRLLRGLTRDAADEAAAFPNRRILAAHGEVEYFARDIGLEIVGRVEGHDAGLSAADVLELMRTVSEKKPAAIVLEAEYPADAAGMLQMETGLPVVLLNPVATGEMDGPFDTFLLSIVWNVRMLARALGEE